VAEPEQPLPDVHVSRLARVLTEWKTLALLGSPILVAQLAQMANGVIDTIMAGHVSAEDLAAVGIGTSLWIPLFLFFVGILSALQPIISGHNGSRALDKIMPVTWQGLYIAAAATVLMIAVLVNVRPIFDLLQLDAQTASISQGYLAAVAWGVPAMLLMTALRGLTDGLGHTRVIMAFSVLSTLINLPLNYILIYGKLGFPAMGGVGCGWATAGSSWLAALALLAYLNWSKTYKNFHIVEDWAPPRWHSILHVLRLGVPIGFTMFVEVSMFSVVALFLAPLGPAVVAAHQIVLNIVSLLFMVPLSLGMGLTLRVSFLLGAQAPATAQLIARSALLLALGIALIYAPALLFLREGIVALYTRDLEVQRIAAQLIVFGAVFQIADVIQVAAISALRGYRDTRIPMFVMLLSFWGICLPLGYVLTFTDLLGPARGASGFWLALTVGLTSAGILLTLRLFSMTSRRAQRRADASARDY
jgi:MATE family multidrug resistance protein